MAACELHFIFIRIVTEPGVVRKINSIDQVKYKRQSCICKQTFVGFIINEMSQKHHRSSDVAKILYAKVNKHVGFVTPE